jgi:hypothetical protein
MGECSYWSEFFKGVAGIILLVFVLAVFVEAH